MIKFKWNKNRSKVDSFALSRLKSWGAFFSFFLEIFYLLQSSIFSVVYNLKLLKKGGGLFSHIPKFWLVGQNGLGKGDCK